MIWRRFDSAADGQDDEKEKLDELLVEYSNIEAEINLYKRRIGLLEEKVGQKKKENVAISALLHATRMVNDPLMGTDNPICFRNWTRKLS